MQCTGLDFACWGNSFLDSLTSIFFGICEALVIGLVAIIDLLPLPIDQTDITNAVSAMPSEIFWAFNIFDVGTGVGMVFTAYLTRFIIRRLPWVG